MLPCVHEIIHILLKERAMENLTVIYEVSSGEKEETVLIYFVYADFDTKTT